MARGPVNTGRAYTNHFRVRAHREGPSSGDYWPRLLGTRSLFPGSSEWRPFFSGGSVTGPAEPPDDRREIRSRFGPGLAPGLASHSGIRTPNSRLPPAPARPARTQRHSKDAPVVNLGPRRRLHDRRTAGFPAKTRSPHPTWCGTPSAAAGGGSAVGASIDYRFVRAGKAPWTAPLERPSTGRARFLRGRRVGTYGPSDAIRHSGSALGRSSARRAPGPDGPAP